MTEHENMVALLLRHCQTYPNLTVRDLFKFLHQSAFGCEHMVSSAEDAEARIEAERETMSGIIASSPAAVEPLDGPYARVPLSLLDEGLSSRTLGRLFYLSAKEGTNQDASERLEAKLALAESLIEGGRLVLSLEEFCTERKQWKEKGYPAVRHSEAFREAYHPSYRVLSEAFLPFLPLFTSLDRLLAKGSVVLAVEGGSAGGKSTLGALLKKVYGCTVFHMDDFFLRPEQRTSERLAETGGNVDRERFLEEVLIPLREQETVRYRPFDCSKGGLAESVTAVRTPLTVVEGAYSMHPDLAHFYDLSVFLDISPACQRERILKRNGETMAQRFFHEWIPLEQVYFEKTDAKKRCDFVISIF